MPLPMRRLFPIRAIGDAMCLMDRDRFVAVVEASPVSFALKSERERRQLTGAFTRFLNSVQFPLQILVRTDVLRLDEYLADIKTRESELEPHLRPALADYLRFLQESSHLEHLLRRRFYLVLRWQGTDSRTRPLKRGEVLWDEAAQQLDRWQATVTEGLRPLGVTVRRLSTEELYSFVFQALNAEDPSREVHWSWQEDPMLVL
jgi:hypothetical protein